MILEIKKKTKLPVLAALIILLCFSLCSCGKAAGGSGTSSAPRYSKYIALTIDASKGEKDGVIANGKRVGINAGETVYAVLKRYCDNNKILIASQKTGNGMYVSAIDGVAQFDHGSGSGWIYSVGGKFPSKDCGSCKLSGGEKVKWIYTLDLGKTEGKSK